MYANQEIMNYSRSAYIQWGLGLGQSAVSLDIQAVFFPDPNCQRMYANQEIMTILDLLISSEG